MIKVDNLNKYYNKNKSNEIHVINDVNLSLPNIGLISFLGTSGSGKTTLLNVIGGLDKASGTICYDSFEMKKYSMNEIDKYRNENFGYVFQTYNLLSNETVYDNLKIALELIDIYDEKETNSRIEYALKSVGMYKYRKKKACHLSGGQQQRVAIARALVKHCKIIIADEPTGNLDSSNAIEVMNILKSISKKTLVLLVTHNEALANFYSDYIYKIEDGKIINHYENQSTNTLQTTNDNIIYLKDMNLVESNSDSINVKLYSNEEKSIDIEIIERNNTFYIKSNRNIKLIENSNIKLINDHYKPVESKNLDEYYYDDSFFNNSIKKKNFLYNLFKSFSRSFSNFIRPTKKIKIIYFSLALIGILFSFCSISISNAVKVDKSQINADDNYYTLATDSNYYYAEDGETLKENLKQGNISSIQIMYTRYTEFSYQLNYVDSKRYNEVFGQLYYNDEVNELVLGKVPAISEIAISKSLADLLLNEFKDCCNTYEDLFSLTVDNYNSKIVGIVKGNYNMIYVNEINYLNELSAHMHIEDNLTRYYKYEKKYNTYEIVCGRDLNDLDYATTNILISDKYPNYQKYIGTEMERGVVVGVFHMNNIDYDMNEIIANIEYNETIKLSYKYSYNSNNYVLVEGVKPTNDLECLISINNSYQVGEYLDGFKIVGRYNAPTSMLSAASLFSTSLISIDDYSTKVFLVENQDKLDSNLENSKFKAKTMSNAEYDKIKEVNKEKMTIFGVLGSICLIATSIMIFFLMRSKMINDIYNIGVYRSLGSSKNKLYLKYFSDTVVMVTFTSLVTYLIITIAYLTSIKSINDYYGSELFANGLLIPILGIIVLYLVNILFGLLPIFTLLKKTPSEIICKYDI